jgi:hypothetical protein
MTKKKSAQPPLKPYTAWALTNWGNPWGTCRTRKEAITLAEQAVGEPWSAAKTHFAVHKVQVTPL